MSTRSNIIAKFDGGNYYGIYCHFDGYLDHNGRILKDHYNTQSKVEKLIKEGDASFIDESLADSVFYHRDRGEDLRLTGPCKTLLDCFEDLDDEDYTYVWEDGKWKVFKWNNIKSLSSF